LYKNKNKKFNNAQANRRVQATQGGPGRPTPYNQLFSSLTPAQRQLNLQAITGDY